MLILLSVYFGLTYFIVLLLGYLQTPASSPNNQAQTSSSEVYSTLGVTAICGQAFVSTAVLAGTSYFAISAIFLAFTLVSHHTIIHRHSRFEGESCSCAPFQLKDISNHETWVVASIVAALVSALNL